MMYYEENALKAILSYIGKPVKIDSQTTLTTRGKFARVYVEVDLNKPLVGRILLDNNWQTVDYEGLHIVYFNYGWYGHSSDGCLWKQDLMNHSENTTTSNGVTDKSMQLVSSEANFVHILRDGNMDCDKRGMEGSRECGFCGPWMVIKKNKCVFKRRWLVQSGATRFMEGNNKYAIQDKESNKNETTAKSNKVEFAKCGQPRQLTDGTSREVFGKDSNKMKTFLQDSCKSQSRVFCMGQFCMRMTRMPCVTGLVLGK